jgi:hypothetical protein
VAAGYLTILLMRAPQHPRSNRWLVLLTKTLTCSDLVHAAVATGDVVIVPDRRDGWHAWPLKAFMERYPGLVTAHVVPVARRAISHPPKERVNVLLSLAKWATFGLVPAPNCVTTVVWVMRAYGIDVPRRIVSPRQLDKWLGERYVKLSDWAPGPEGR